MKLPRDVVGPQLVRALAVLGYEAGFAPRSQRRDLGHPAMSEANESMNVYEELGFPDSAEMLVKAQLVVKIAQILRERGWSQQEAAKVLGLTQPKLSKMLRGQFRGISEMKMMDCLVRLGRTVKIVVGPEGGAADERIEVVAA
jgi:predicted XRE-type DNA-binding protein